MTESLGTINLSGIQPLEDEDDTDEIGVILNWKSK